MMSTRPPFLRRIALASLVTATCLATAHAADAPSVQQQLTANAQRLVPAINQLLNYVHQRTLQRMTLEAVRESEHPTSN